MEQFNKDLLSSFIEKEIWNQTAKELIENLDEIAELLLQSLPRLNLVNVKCHKVILTDDPDRHTTVNDYIRINRNASSDYIEYWLEWNRNTLWGDLFWVNIKPKFETKIRRFVQEFKTPA